MFNLTLLVMFPMKTAELLHGHLKAIEAGRNELDPVAGSVARHRLARVTLGARVLRGIAVRGSRDEHGLNGAFYNIQLYIHNMCEPSSLNQHVHHCLAYHWRKPRPWS